MEKKGLIAKTWDRCCKSKPRPRKPQPPPRGWLPVYVGEAREQFLVRPDHLSHPAFRALLEAAEEAFGYATDGPLELPCDPGLFRSLLWEIEQDADEGPVASTCPSPMCFRHSYEKLGPVGAASPWRTTPRRSTRLQS